MKCFVYFLLVVCFLAVLSSAETAMATAKDNTKEHPVGTEQPHYMSARSGNAGRKRKDQQRKISRKELSTYAWAVLDSADQEHVNAEGGHIYRRTQQTHSDAPPNTVILGANKGLQHGKSGSRRPRSAGRGPHLANPHLANDPASASLGSASASPMQQKDSYLRYCSKHPTCQVLGEHPRSELTDIDTKELKKTSACIGVYRLLRVQALGMNYYMNQTMGLLPNQTRQLCSFEHESMKTILEQKDILQYETHDALQAYLLTPSLYVAHTQRGVWLNFILEEQGGNVPQIEKDTKLMLQQVDLIRAHRGMLPSSLQQHVFSTLPALDVQYNKSHIHLHNGAFVDTLKPVLATLQPAQQTARKRDQRTAQKGAGLPILGINIMGHPATYASPTELQHQLKDILRLVFPYLHRQCLIRVQRGDAAFVQGMLSVMMERSLGLELLPIRGRDDTVLFLVHYVRV